MVALAPTPPSRVIRVYCPTHKVGFSAPASAVVQCGSQKHTLSTVFRDAGFWEYCCDCQHFWPLDAAKGNTAADECPVCERMLRRSFLCEECQVVSAESDNPGRRKEFSISSDGLPQPACPGCLHKSTATKVKHECADFGRAFITTRTTCPFCDQQLYAEPRFPCSVSVFRKTVRPQLPTLQFDSQSNLLTESSSGIYLLLDAGRSRLPIVVPATSHLSSKQDYYSLYYEVFNCDNPAAGEVFIVSPAIVEKVENGWSLREPGFIEIKADSATIVSPEQPNLICGVCGTRSRPGHVFCRSCGSHLKPAERAQVVEAVTADITDATGDHSFQPDREAPVYSATETQPGSTPSYPWKPFLAAVAGIAIMGILFAVIVSSTGGSNSLEKKLDRAITAGNFFTPATENAHDLYLQLKNSGASEQALRQYRERILPALTNRPLRMINDFMVPGSDEVSLVEWQEATRSLKWAAELKSDDHSLQARALYAEGRIAYLSKDENLAISIWARAADTDQSWPLPINGIGLIYTGRRNYETARRYYQVAIERDPAWAYPYNNMGTAHYMQKNYNEAKNFYQKAAQLAPRWARPHSWLGDIAMKEGDYNTAIAEFNLALDPNATGVKNMDLEKIRRQLALAQQRAVLSSF